ncbi:MAG: hypothetical protein EBZ03_04450 [Betaproteobacteria bacterium]|nr:hypothetical protein [Betaproteobacteria bacterium]NBP61352.1 hypothetical protein [Betaproteobacteria bacterium]NBQ81210.1 hypothetical protein [Betaproteobacteria bacterium]NBS20924.1 hypothetical protein [Betaproteobacteria bacterium]NBT65097.1 hypothetical protein [Betaproteobacteria bacterium]
MPKPNPSFYEIKGPMIDCLILGDEIAEGIKQFRQECVTKTQPNTATERWVRDNGVKFAAKTVIISLGTYDPPSQTIENEALGHLSKLRASIDAEQVFWLLPAKAKPADAMRELARLYKDHLMIIEEKQRNQIHPSERGAELLATQSRIKGKMDWTRPTWPKGPPPLVGG